MNAIAHATASEIILAGGQLPTHVQWMPPGRQTVQPVGFDAPFEMNVTAGLALQANTQLQELRRRAAAGRDAEPYFDFNHKDEGRSFIPSRFFWGGDDPKTGGIRAEGTWTGAGARAVRDGELCCVSASWVLNKFTNEFLGIKHNVGGLVPRSAFHAVQAFAKAGSAPISELDLTATIRRINQTYGVRVGLNSPEPLMEAADQLAQTNCTGYMLELNRLILLEPELGRYLEWKRTGTDPARNAELQAEINRLRAKTGEDTAVNSRAAADEMMALAKDYQKRLGLIFVEAWAMARNALRGENLPPEQQIANAVYMRALELRRTGLSFDEAYAAASAETTT